VAKKHRIAAFGADAGRNFFSELFIHITADNMRTLTRKNAHDGRTHTLRRTSDDGDSVLNASHIWFSDC
jgi:hypothetical protein